MPRYFFHVHEEASAPDKDGLLCPTMVAALVEAYRTARAVAADQVLRGRLHLSHRIDVADEGGAIVATVTFRDAVTVER